MGIFNFWKKEENKHEVTNQIVNALTVDSGTRLGGSYSIGFDGEKNYGEIGPVVDYNLDYYKLASRSWKSYMDSEIAKTVFDKYSIWIIDKGLKLQSLPAVTALKSEGVDIDLENTTKLIESRFNIYSKSKRASFNNMSNLNQLSKDTFKTSIISGDCLVVLRVKKGNLSVEIIDGRYVKGGYNNNAINGVECDSTGKHINYYVAKENGGFEKISAWSKSGFRMAFMVYGSKYKIDSRRGVPQIATSMESIAKMDRYKEASLKKAEEQANVVYSIEHENYSDGSNPMASTLARSYDVDSNTIDNANSYDSQGAILQNKVQSSTNGTAIDMGLGRKLKAFETTGQLEFKEFYETNANPICSAMGIPPNVAFSIYNDSFSASRAATKDWDHTIDVRRDDFQCQFYDPIYSLWLHLEVMKGNILIDGYLTAFMNDNWIITESIYNCKFTGPLFPHIDPLKEVNAERAKLGPQYKDIPLTTGEDATERLNSGDFVANQEQASKELEFSKNLNIYQIEPSENNS